MKPLLIIALLFITTISSSQTVEETYPKTLWCPNDTFYIKYKGLDKLFPYKVSRTDKTSPGTDASPGEYAIFYYGTDSFRLDYKNRIPYAQITFINFKSPKGETTLRFHYNELFSYFSKEYMQTHSGRVQYDIPEAYELANVIWTLSPAGQRAKDLNKAEPYYKEVLSYFKPYRNHPIFKALDVPDSLYSTDYFNFRENSFAFNFDSSKSQTANLFFNGPYYYVVGEELADSSLFGKLKPLVEDFARQSNFRRFYKDHYNFYQKEIKREQQLLPVKQMWSWLEIQFPKRSYDSYRIVFSPLIGRSHSTQNYATYNQTKWFQECVMFICDSYRVDTLNISDKEREAMLSGVVFTEIDHNYVNPASGKYGKLIDSIFSKRETWANAGNNSDYYNNARSVFNEYMTWAVFSLYLLDTYDSMTATKIADQRAAMMVDQRNFIRYKQFNQALINIRMQHKDLKVVDLYPYILDWSKDQLNHPH